MKNKIIPNKDIKARADIKAIQRMFIEPITNKMKTKQETKTSFKERNNLHMDISDAVVEELMKTAQEKLNDKAEKAKGNIILKGK